METLGDLIDQLGAALARHNELVGKPATRPAYPQTSTGDVEFSVGDAKFRAQYTVVHVLPWKSDRDDVVVEDVYLLGEDCEVVLPDFLVSKVLDEAQEAADAEYAK